MPSEHIECPREQQKAPKVVLFAWEKGTSGKSIKLFRWI